MRSVRGARWWRRVWRLNTDKFSWGSLLFSDSKDQVAAIGIGEGGDIEAEFPFVVVSCTRQSAFIIEYFLLAALRLHELLHILLGELCEALDEDCHEFQMTSLPFSESARTLLPCPGLNLSLPKFMACLVFPGTSSSGGTARPLILGGVR